MLNFFDFLPLVTPGDPGDLGWSQKWLHSIPRAISFNLLGQLY